MNGNPPTNPEHGATRDVELVAPQLAAYRARGFWPEPQHEAVLRAALLAPPQLTDALASWQELDRESLDHTTLTILPLLYRNLELHDEAPELRHQLAGYYRWSWHRNQLLLAATKHALGTLHEVGVTPTMMKGVPLTLDIYRDMGVRVMRDVDLVVRRADLDRALHALTGAGWTAQRALTPELTASLGGIELRNSRGLALDLHWHVLQDSYDTSVDETLIDGAEPLTVGSQQVAVLNPTDHLLLVITHGLSWSADPPIHWITDAVMLLRLRGDDIDWQRLTDLSSRTRTLHTLQSGLGFLRQRLGEELPAGCARLLAARPHRTERLAMWFAQRSAAPWLWGRAPLVAASYLRSRRAKGRWPTPLGLLRFLGARADCSPGEWLRRAFRVHTRRLFRIARTGR